LRAERKEDGTRTFKLIQAEPLRTSYGEDLYNKIFVGKSTPEGTGEPELVVGTNSRTSGFGKQE
jgi:hypothetical protein